MKTPVVVDASALIVLERIGRLELLPALYAPVLAPPAVVREFGTAPAWLEVAAPAALPPSDTKALRPIASRGEADAIAAEPTGSLLCAVSQCVTVFPYLLHEQALIGRVAVPRSVCGDLPSHATSS